MDEETRGSSSASPGPHDQNTFPTISVGEFDETWTPPNGWDGPDAVLYKSFDNMTNLVFMEGDQKVNMVPMVNGKVGIFICWSQ